MVKFWQGMQILHLIYSSILKQTKQEIKSVKEVMPFDSVDFCTLIYSSKMQTMLHMLNLNTQD